MTHFHIIDLFNKYNLNVYAELDKNNIKYKLNEEHNIVLIFSNYGNKFNDLQKECRSLVIDLNSNNIISYSCPNLILNNNIYKNVNINKIKELDNYILTIAHEGIMISLFYHLLMISFLILF
jgi:hypothetical protein